MRCLFGVTAELYYKNWGEFFHLAIFEEGDDRTNFDAAFERTHQRYFDAIGGAQAGRILELATGGGAFAEWMAGRTPAEVVGVDLSDAQLKHARQRLVQQPRTNLRFVKHDIMQLADLKEPPFDAIVYMDAACYLPDKAAALRGIASRLRKGGRFLLIDWCRPEAVAALQEELILEPFYRYWSIPTMETVEAYQRSFAAAGFRLLQVDDLSSRVALNWERGYEIANRVLAEPTTAGQLVTIAQLAFSYGLSSIQVAKDQFYAIVFAKLAADAGLLRYVSFLAERVGPG
jgi:cyclopropane fatty-acyl-phospholipid synthase-like methyltransferase